MGSSFMDTVALTLREFNTDFCEAKINATLNLFISKAQKISDCEKMDEFYNAIKAQTATRAELDTLFAETPQRRGGPIICSMIG